MNKNILKITTILSILSILPSIALGNTKTLSKKSMTKTGSHGNTISTTAKKQQQVNNMNIPEGEVYTTTSTTVKDSSGNVVATGSSTLKNGQGNAQIKTTKGGSVTIDSHSVNSGETDYNVVVEDAAGQTITENGAIMKNSANSYTRTSEDGRSVTRKNSQ